MRPFPSLRRLADGLARREWSSAELTEAALQRAKRLDGALNCFITLDEDKAMAAAERADQLLGAAPATPLTGVPLAHKDIFCMKGWRTTCASRMLADFVAPYTATAIARLEDAGCVTLGKLNMDEFAMGSSTETSHFGPTANPWSLERSPGGSSGGSAACVAAGITAAASGTDTGGSIRQPAGFCGLVGLKPTYGKVSRYGMIAFASSLDQGGVLARSAEDAALVLSYMAGFDPRDSTSSKRRDPWLEAVPQAGVGALEDSPLTIGLVKEFFAEPPVGGQLIEAARRSLEGLGLGCVDLSLPNVNMAMPAYYVIAGAEASTNLARYDGVRFGHRCTEPGSLADLYERSRSEGFGAEVKRRILTGTYALSAGYFDAYYIRAQKIRRLVAQDFAAAFAQADLLLAPTSPGVAFRRGQLLDDPLAMYQQDAYTIPVNLAGLPALSLPCGLQDGLPVGFQLIANHFDERRLLQAGAALQRVTDWHEQRPSLDWAEAA